MNTLQVSTLKPERGNRMKKDIFPQSIASGYSFCNRVEKRKTLRSNIDRINHTVLIAPRRYGKSSLSNQVAIEWEATKRIYKKVSLYSAYDEKTALELIAKSVQQAIIKMTTTFTIDDFKKLLAAFSSIGLNASLKSDGADFSITFNFGADNKTKTPGISLTSLGELLKTMDEVALKGGWNIVFEMDEFQQIASLETGHAIEAQIRDAVQYVRATTFIFLGSNRHMLEQMFSDKSRPFYKLCRIIRLDRINAEHYRAHLQDASRIQWNKDIPDEAINQVLSLTERHPFYVNALCSRLWAEEQPPKPEDIELAWSLVVDEHMPMLRNDFARLSATQKAILSLLAHSPEEHVTGSDFLNRLDKALSTVRDSFRYLKSMDMVYHKDDKLWAVMDPCLSFDLRRQS